MRATPACQQLGGKRTTAGSGADSEARRASHLDAGDHGRHRDHEHDKEAPRPFLLILLRAGGNAQLIRSGRRSASGRSEWRGQFGDGLVQIARLLPPKPIFDLTSSG